MGEKWNEKWIEKTGQGLAGTGSSFRGKCFQGKKTAVMVRHSCAAVSSHVAATATDSYNCRLFAQEVLIPSKRRQPLPTLGLFLATLSRSVRAREFSFFDRLFYFFGRGGVVFLETSQILYGILLYEILIYCLEQARRTFFRVGRPQKAGLAGQ